MAAQFIGIELGYPIKDGMDIIFDAPCNCSEVSGLAITYNGTRTVFTFRDAHKNDLSDLSEAFTSGARVKVNLDIVNGYAYIQNADTNAYLEEMFKNRLPAMEDTTAGNTGCYYRMVDGEKEYINPPMRVNNEYRTTERFLGKPVYTRIHTITFGGNFTSSPFSMPDASNIRCDIWYKGSDGFLKSHLEPGSPVTVTYDDHKVITSYDLGSETMGYVYMILKYTKA